MALLEQVPYTFGIWQANIWANTVWGTPVLLRGGVIIRIIQMFEYQIMGALIRIIFE